MRKNDTKLFLDKEKLYELTNLRRNGWGFVSIANYFGCDISSVRAQCKKYKIEPYSDVFTIEHVISALLFNMEKDTCTYLDYDGERINKGKNYADYLKVAGINQQKISPKYLWA